jgi:TetR/AcrR family transcriptional regulator, ethionamide resistance regulator
MGKKRTNENIKELILKETENLLQSKNFSDISLRDVAESCHISSGTIYYYYQNKSDIVYDIFSKRIDELYNELTEWIENKEKDTSLHRIVRFVLLKGTGSPVLRLNLLAECTNGNNVLKNKMISKYNTFNDSLCKKIENEYGPEEAKYLAWLILILTDGAIVHKGLQNPSFDFEDFVNQTEKLCLKISENKN